VFTGQLLAVASLLHSVSTPELKFSALQVLVSANLDLLRAAVTVGLATVGGSATCNHNFA
jgi:hypothetical protein